MTFRISFVAILGAVFALASCRDPVNLIALRDTVTDTLEVYALTGTPLSYPTALVTPAHTVVRADGNVDFDVAFDIDAEGNALLYPFVLVVDPTAVRRTVGIRKMTVSFEEVTLAPTSGYKYDSVTVAPEGTVAVIQATRDLECQHDLVSRTIYSKIVIDDIDTVNRRIAFRILVDPSCGFRDLVPGRPKR